MANVKRPKPIFKMTFLSYLTTLSSIKCLFITEHLVNAQHFFSVVDKLLVVNNIFSSVKLSVDFKHFTLTYLTICKKSVKTYDPKIRISSFFSLNLQSQNYLKDSKLYFRKIRMRIVNRSK